MRIIVTCVALLALTTSVASARSVSDLAQATADLQKQAETKLGFGLRSIGLLLQVKPNAITQKGELVKSGDWPLLEQLQRKGFVKLARSTMSPPGSTDEWVTISLTSLGEAVVLPARGEQPN